MSASAAGKPREAREPEAQQEAVIGLAVAMQRNAEGGKRSRSQLDWTSQTHSQTRPTMFAPKRLLIAVDFSPSSAAALRFGLDLASRTGAEPHVLHVVPDFAALELDIETLYSAPERRDRAEARHTADRELYGFLGRERAAGEGLVRAVALGKAAPTVLDYAATHQIDLVVVGTHGRRGLRRLVLGSVANEVLHRAGVPVLVVPEGSDSTLLVGAGVPGTGAPRRVLAPTDFSQASRFALPIAAALAALYDAHLDVVHALEPVPYLTETMGIEIAGSFFDDLRRRAQDQLDEAAASVRPDEGLEAAGWNTTRPGTAVPVPTGASVTTELADGRAADIVPELARSLGSGLIVMARRGLGGLLRLALGSVTERVCRQTPCPVLVLPPHASPDPPDAPS